MKKIVSRLLIVLFVLLTLLALWTVFGVSGSPFASSVPMTITPLDQTLFSPAPCTYSNDISLPLSNNFCAKNSDLKIISTDGKAHTCTFTGVNSVTIAISQGQNSSTPFQLGLGDYTLKCDSLPASVKVSVN